MNIFIGEDFMKKLSLQYLFREFQPFRQKKRSFFESYTGRSAFDYGKFRRE